MTQQSKVKKEALDEARAKADQEQLDAETKEVAQKIEGILNAGSFALQSYLHMNVEAGVVTGIIPRVRLIKVQKNEEAK